jgi:photosystem II stability/assembly factor-like uncharacterized protein
MKTSIHTALLIILFAVAVPHLLYSQWQQTNGPYGGQVTAFAVNGSTLFAATGRGGVYRSTDYGEHWTTVNTGLTSYQIFAFAASGSNLVAQTGSGVYRSTDNGEHWNRAESGLPAGAFVQTLVVNGTEFYAMPYGMGVYRSTDGGVSWSTCNSRLPDSLLIGLTVVGTDLIAVTGGAVTGYVETFRSSDSGASWTPLQVDSDSVRMGAIATIGNYLIASVSDKGVLRSSDNGSTWQKVGTGLPAQWISRFVVSGGTLFGLGSNGIYRSVDSGATWKLVGTELNNIGLWTIATIDTDLFVGTNVGAYRIGENDTEWTEINEGMKGASVKALAFDGAAMFAAGTKQHTVFRSTSSGADWEEFGAEQDDVDLGDSFLNGGLVTHRGNIFAITSRAGIFRSSDNGEHWSPVNEGLPSLYTYSIAASNSYLFVGTGSAGIYRSSDNGATWEEANTGIGEPSSSDVIPVHCLAIRGEDIFAGTGYGQVIYHSTDNGDHWSAMNAGISGSFSGVRALATNGTHALVMLGNKLYRSSNNGGIWDSVDIDVDILGNTAPGFLVPGTLAAIGDNFYMGIYARDTVTDAIRPTIQRSTDNGLTWTSISEAMLDNRALSFGSDGTYLYAGTEGHGVWRRPLAELPSGVRTEPSQPVADSAVQIHPNPATSSTLVRYHIDNRTWVSITIHDAMGRIVSQPVAGAMQEAGEHQIPLPTDELGAGVYMCSVDAGGVERAVRFVVVR